MVAASTSIGRTIAPYSASPAATQDHRSSSTVRAATSATVAAALPTPAAHTMSSRNAPLIRVRPLKQRDIRRGLIVRTP